MIECEFINEQDEKIIKLQLSPNTTILDIINNHLKIYFNHEIQLKYDNQICEDNKTLKDFQMTKLIFYIIDASESDDDSYENECAIDYKAYEKNKEINIKFLKVSNEFNPKKYDKIYMDY